MVDLEGLSEIDSVRAAIDNGNERLVVGPVSDGFIEAIDIVTNPLFRSHKDMDQLNSRLELLDFNEPYLEFLLTREAVDHLYRAFRQEIETIAAGQQRSTEI